MSQNSKEKKNLCWKKSDVRYLSAEDKKADDPSVGILLSGRFPGVFRILLYRKDKRKQDCSD